MQRVLDLPGVGPTWRLARELQREWSDDRGTGLAAEIAFWLVLSIFPGLLVFGAALGWLDSILGASVAARVEREVIEGIDAALGAEAGPISGAAEELFASPNAGALTFGAVFALFSFSRGFNAVVGALDVAYDIEVERSWFHARLTAIGLGIGTVIIGALTLTMLFIGPLFGRAGQLGTWFTTGWQLLGPLAAFAALVAWAATIYHIAPLHRSPWRWDLPGALFAATFWVVATVGFRIYVDSAIGGSNAILGAVGAVLTLLLWVYLLAIGLLVGAEINQIIADRLGVSLAHYNRRTVRASARDLADRARRVTGRRLPDAP